MEMEKIKEAKRQSQLGTSPGQLKTPVTPTEVKIPISTTTPSLRSKSPFSESLFDRWDSKIEEVMSLCPYQAMY